MSHMKDEMIITAALIAQDQADLLDVNEAALALKTSPHFEHTPIDEIRGQLTECAVQRGVGIVLTETP